MAKRLLLITQWFDPEPTFKGLVFARELVKRGFEVEVLTGFPNYPGGKLYPGYKVRLLQRELIDGVEVTRVPLYPSHDQSASRRIFNYLSFLFTALIYGLFKAKRPDVIYAYHPPLTVGVTAALLRVFRKIPVVYDIQDMWPDTLQATGMITNRRLLAVVGRVCDWVYRRVDSIVVLSPGFKQLLIERGVPEAKIDVIYNWCAEDALASSVSEKRVTFSETGEFHILFAGNMGKAQALDSVLEAAQRLKVSAPSLVFVFLGDGIEVDRLKNVANKKSLTNVIFLPSVPFGEVGTYLKSADALFVHLKQDPLFHITIPSKTQAYMAVGKPILMAVDGDAADLVHESLCGMVAESESPDSIANSAIMLMNASKEERDQMADNGRLYYQEKLSLHVGSGRFADIFDRLASND
jgi:colanic acid biosynthesis glycosyl transferase WcaI